MTGEIDDTEETPVLFRADHEAGQTCITAVFPCSPADNCGMSMVCYAHVGQHSGCSLAWYNTTRAATPEEYADLQRELEGAPFRYRLKIYKRMQRGAFLAARRAVLRGNR